MTSLLSIVNTSPQDWKYVAEGGANIIFSYNGGAHPDPHFNGMILRLRKTTFLQRDITQDSTCAVTSALSGFPSVNRPNDTDEPDDQMIEFQRKVIGRLIPPEYLPQLTPIRVERAWLQDLANLCDSVRPSHRRQNDHIDVTKTKAVLVTDLIGSNALVVEIKVKRGGFPPFVTPA